MAPLVLAFGQIGPHDLMNQLLAWSPMFVMMATEAIRHCEPIKQYTFLVWFKERVTRHAFNFCVANLDRLLTKLRLVTWE
ncbi:hypothetical protein HID58_025417 [Brassica napus]|uniref:Uncharacterized protein n=1 Tax=Brassica napus TaxID=3708 RepID=A0ABQ8CL17_BRANA|nr:hypothetical protein HID58_025417 [Brassica napus]